MKVLYQIAGVESEDRRAAASGGPDPHSSAQPSEFQPTLYTWPGKRLHNYGKSPFIMGKPTVNGHVQ